MKEIIRDRANEIVIALAIFCLSLLCFNLVTDDYAFFVGSVAARQFSDFAYFDFHFQGFIGTRELLKLLYYLAPRVNWHFVFMMVYDVVSLYLVLRVLRLVILKKTNNIFLIRVVQILFALFYVENLVFVSHTRVSLIFCGVALFNLLFIKNIRGKTIFFNSLLFIFGMLLRPESGMGMLLLVPAGYFIYTFNLKELIKRIWIPGLAVAVFITVFAIDTANTNLFIRKVEPEIEYKMMAKRVVDLGQMKTAKDSLKYQASLVGMWFDVDEVSPSFMRSIILPGIDTDAMHIRDVFMHVVQLYSDYPFIWCFIIALVVLSIFLLPDYGLRITKILLFELCTFAIVYALDYNGFLVSNRHFMGLQFMSLLVMCFYFFDAPAFKNKAYVRGLSGAILFFLFGSVILTLVRYKNEEVAVDNEVGTMIKTMKAFERKYTNRIVVITIDSRFLFDGHFSLLNETYTKNTYLMFDWFTYPLTPRYVNYISGKCHCDGKDPAAFFRWLSANNALYIASPDRMDLTEKYLKTVDHCNVTFDSGIKVNSLAGVKNDQTERDEIRTVHVTPN